MRKILRAVFLLLAVGFTVAAAADAPALQFDLKIARQPLPAALQELGVATRLSIAYLKPSGSPSDSVPLAGPLQGRYTVESALTQLLAGTGLVYAWLDSRTINITQAGKQPPINALQSPQKVGDVGKVANLQGGEAQLAAAGDVGARTGVARSVAEEDVLPARSIDEVIVTGTSIHGVSPAGSPVITYTRSDIAKTGAGSVREFVRKVPQNFGLTDQETVQNNGNSTLADTNGTRGTGVNLRGLGAGSTLTLLNGQRLAPSGSQGSFVDVSLVPLSAVERIEMMTDGASAIYGADAVGGVVNFILRRDFSGGETSVRYGDSSSGGGEQLTVSQLLGASWDGGNAMLVYEYQDESGVDAAERDFVPPFNAMPGRFSIIPGQLRNSAIVSVRHELTSNLEMSARGLYSRREFNEDTATSVGPVHAEGEAQSTAGNLGMTLGISESWTLSAAADYSVTKQDSSTTTIGASFVAARESKSSGIDVRLGGELFDIGRAAARASIGIGARSEKLDLNRNTPGELDRKAKSAYGELFLPLIAPSASEWTHKLDVSLAARVDDYDDFGSSGVKPKVGVAWWPTASVGLRASWSESFRAPLLSQMDTTLASPFPWLVLRLPDPASATGTTATIIPLIFGNPDLDAETAESLTFGVDFSPESLPHFRSSLTYYEIDYKDRVSLPPLPGNNYFLLYQRATELSPFIDRSPDPAQVAQWYGEGVANPFGIPASGVAAHYDGRYQNISTMKTSGIELSLGNTFETAVGALDPFIQGNYILDLDTRAASTTPEQRLFDRLFTPARLRIRSGLSWSTAAISTTLSASYVGSYVNDTLATPADIDEWLTFDWHMQYETGDSAGAMLRGLTVALDVQNLTDEDPPHVTVPASMQTFNYGYDATNASAMGRFISLQVRKRW